MTIMSGKKFSLTSVAKSSAPLAIVVCLIGLLIVRQMKKNSGQSTVPTAIKGSNADSKSDPTLADDLSNKRTWVLTPNGVNPVGPQQGTTQINTIKVPVGEEAKQEARKQNQFARTTYSLKAEDAQYGVVIVSTSSSKNNQHGSGAVVLNGGSTSEKRNQFSKLYGDAMQQARTNSDLQVFVQYVAPLTVEVAGTGTTKEVDNPSSPDDLFWGTDYHAKRPLSVTDPDSGEIWMDKTLKITEADRAQTAIDKLFATPELLMDGALQEADKDYLAQFKDGRGKIVAHQRIDDIRGKIIEWSDPKAEDAYKNYYKK